MQGSALTRLPERMQHLSLVPKQRDEMSRGIRSADLALSVRF